MTCIAVCVPFALSGAAVAGIDSAGQLEAAYTATLLGFPIGHISWTVETDANDFSAKATGATAGLLRIFSPGHGMVEAGGTLSGQRPEPLNFLLSITHGSASEEIKILFSGGKAKEFLKPPLPANPQVVPLTAAHRTDVVDPMTGLLIQVPGAGDTIAPAACDRKIAVFDGRMRYDLRLDYKRLERVKAERGYEGPAVVCAVYFDPLAGYDPNRYAIKYLRAERGMEIWLAPLAGSRLLVPFRVSVPTPIGPGVLQATRFIWTQRTDARAR